MRFSLSRVPRGNTCPGVNRAVIEYLVSKRTDFAGQTIFDVPCGNGDLLDVVKALFPGSRTIGADIKEPSSFAHEFHRFDAEQSDAFKNISDCRLITCVSGVMEFDNTSAFLRNLAAVSTADATIIVTNDNLATVRDRILYFLFGRFRQFKTTPGSCVTTWKIIHIANLVRSLNDAGFRVDEVRYVIGSWAEWLWLPLAAPIYFLQLLYFMISERETPLAEKTKFFPFTSTLARHYLLICGKNSESAASASPFGTN